MIKQVNTTETHTRTITKLILYRILSLIIAFFLTLLLGGNPMQALQVTGLVLLTGSIHYYLYDRLCLYFSWGRSEEGQDNKKRTLIKTVIYRVSALIVLMIIARSVFTDSNWVAFTMASLKFVTNFIMYYIFERVFNKIEWGKVHNVETTI